MNSTLLLIAFGSSSLILANANHVMIAMLVATAVRYGILKSSTVFAFVHFQSVLCALSSRDPFSIYHLDALYSVR